VFAEPTDRLALLERHARVLAGDSVARTQVSEVLFELLRRRLRAVKRVGDPHAVDTAAEDAVLIYLRRPSAYDQRRGDLVAWLLRIAVNRLRDIDRSRRRRSVHEVEVGVDLAGLGIPVSGGGDADDEPLWIARYRQAILVAARTPEERSVVQARLAGAGRPAELQALGLDHLPPGRARARLNQIWQNLRRRAGRLALRGKFSGRR
jgi:DNA-directed RNA polymerase specialized sigma24 family protein